MLIEKQRKTMTDTKGKCQRTVQASGSKLNETKVSKQKEMQMRKKQTRRGDKKIGRKPSKIMKTACIQDHEKGEKASRPKSLAKHDLALSADTTHNKDNICGNCEFEYGGSDDPLIEDSWSQCKDCTRWCHESCGTTLNMQFCCAKCE